MLLDSIYDSFPATSVGLILILVPALYVVSWTIYTRTFHPLSNIPGPFLASLSRAWIVVNTLRGNMDQLERALHKKYGPIIRVAPDEIVCADPDAVRKIYRYQDPLAKTDFYLPWASGRKAFSKHLDLFTELDDKKHGERRRILNHIYSLTNVLRFESYIDECSEMFISKIDKLADGKQVVDLGQWFQWYTFDMIGQLFFGKMFGFMTEAKDHESWIQALDILTPYLLAMSLVPAYARFLVGLSTIFSTSARLGLEAMGRIVEATKSSVSERVAEPIDTEDGFYRSDLLQQMLDITREKGEKVDFGMGDIQSEAHVAIFAGSDTTAIVMRSVAYYLMRHPDVYRQLQEEIDQAANDGTLGLPVKYSEAIKLPLLCATIKEAIRLHPSVGMSLPRVSPLGGIELANTYVPQGYRVGVNPAVVQYDQSVFGPDSDKFRPARWLEDNTANMDKHILAFGTGTRTCIGRHIALAEVHKLLPHLLRRFDLELVDPEREWITHDMFINKQTGINVRIKHRACCS